MRGKKGQFYLVAAMIIIAVVIGIFSITNYTKQSDSDDEMKILERELNAEIQKNFEYIYQNSLSGPEIQILWTNFSEAYMNNIGSNKNVLFLFGASSQTFAKGERLEGFVDLQINNGSGFYPLTNGVGEFGETFTLSGNEITIREENIDYVFNLEEGQHFYYLISKENKGERVIIKR